MKKLLLILLILIFLGTLSGGIYYVWVNSETRLRENIRNELYKDQLADENDCIQERFERQACLNAISCISDKLAENVRKEDLKEVSKKMKEGYDEEQIIVEYFSSIGISHSKIEESMYQDCLVKYGLNKEE